MLGATLGSLATFVLCFHALGPIPVITPDALWVKQREATVVWMLGALILGLFLTVYMWFDHRHRPLLSLALLAAILLSVAYDWERFSIVIEVVRIHAG